MLIGKNDAAKRAGATAQKDTRKRGDLALYCLLIGNTAVTHSVVHEMGQNQVPEGSLNSLPEQEELTLSERMRVTPATVGCQALQKRDPVLLYVAPPPDHVFLLMSVLQLGSSVACSPLATYDSTYNSHLLPLLPL